MEASGKAAGIAARTGLVLNPYFSATKIRWILQNVPAAREKLAKGKLLAGTIDTWLMWKLTNGRVHATDVSNASRTLLFNIREMKWDDELLKLFGVPKEILPEVKPSSGTFGAVVPTLLSRRAMFAPPICGVAGDQQASLFGQLCVEPGMVKNTYGTGCFALMNIGENPVASRNRLLTTVAWQIGSGKPVYALEGSVFVAGSAIQWLRDGLRLIYNAAESDFYCGLVGEDSEQNVYVVPSFTGLGAPYWDSYSRGAVFGLERGTRREHLIKATLESIAYQSNDLLEAMAKDVGKPIATLKVDGGASRSNYLMQFQASISGVSVVRPRNAETTALGAAYLSGLAAGVWKSVDELKRLNPVDREFSPVLSKEKTEKMLRGWTEAVKRTFN